MPAPTGSCANEPRGTAQERTLPSEDRALRNFRYVVNSIDDSALAVWADLWREFQHQVTPGGVVAPQLDQGFVPSCGWSEFLEKFWLLKHYIYHCVGEE